MVLCNKKTLYSSRSLRYNMITTFGREKWFMPKITFMGAGSTVFAKNVLGDSMLTPALAESTIALYDIDPQRLEES